MVRQIQLLIQLNFNLLALTIIGLLLPMRAISTMLGLWASTTALCPTAIAIRTITFMLGVLETDSDLIFDLMSL